MDQALFEIAGNPRKKVIWDLPSYIAVFPGHIYIEADGEWDDIDIRDVFNIFIQEPVSYDLPSRTTVVDYYFEGDEMRYVLSDETYPGLSFRMEEMLTEYWREFREKKQYPDTIRWFLSCTAVFAIHEEHDPEIFGGMFDTMEASVIQKNVMAEVWGIENRPALRQKMDQLVCEGSAFGLVLCIRLASAGFVCGYMTRRGALEMCLLAGQKLQERYSGWNEMMENCLREFSLQKKQELEDENSEAYDLMEIHRNLLAQEKGPYSTDFLIYLSNEW